MSITTPINGPQTVNYCVRCELNFLNRHAETFAGIIRNPGLCRECAPRVKHELKQKMSLTWKTYMNAVYGPVGSPAL